jgi:hypothetical protein
MVIEVNNITMPTDADLHHPTSSFHSSSNASDSMSANPLISPSVDAQDAIKHLESYLNKQLSPMLKKIATESYNIHYRENRGITREDLVNRFQYSLSTAKKIMYECKCNKILTHLEGHKQGRFKEYFLVTEIERFLQKQVNKNNEKNQGRQQQLIHLNSVLSRF